MTIGRRAWLVGVATAASVGTLASGARADAAGRQIEVALRPGKVVVRVRVTLREVLAASPSVAPKEGDAFRRDELDPLVIAYAQRLPDRVALKADGATVHLELGESALETRGDRRIARATDLVQVHAHVELSALLTAEPLAFELALPGAAGGASDEVTLRREGDREPLDSKAATPGQTVKLEVVKPNKEALPADDTPPRPAVDDGRKMGPASYFAVPLVTLGVGGVAWWLYTRRGRNG